MKGNIIKKVMIPAGFLAVVIIAVVLCAALIWIIDSIFSMLFRMILQ